MYYASSIAFDEALGRNDARPIQMEGREIKH